jgi:hypothetical protein
MPKQIVKEGVLVVRDGKRVYPKIGMQFDFTQAEIDQLQEIRPQAIAPLNAAKVDPQSQEMGSGSAGADEDTVDLSTLKLAELKEQAEARGLPTTGTKAELIAAIQAHDEDGL